MKDISTFFLKIVILIIGALVLALCAFLLPVVISSDIVGGYRPILIGLYVTAIPFFIALYQGLRILHYIDKNKAFSALSVKSLNCIKYCALTISAIYTAGLPYIYYVADKDDAPGVLAMALVVTGSSIVIATSAAVLHKLLQAAISIKSENDLTV